MDPVELTKTEVKLTRTSFDKVQASIQNLRLDFVKRFANQECVKDELDNEVSLELQETYSKLEELEGLMRESAFVLSEIDTSMQFIKDNQFAYEDARFIVRRMDLFSYLMDNVAVGTEDEWFLIFTFAPHIPSGFVYMNNRVYYRCTMTDLIADAHKIGEHGEDFNEDDFFFDGYWGEKESFAIVTPEDKLIRVVD